MIHRYYIDCEALDDEAYRDALRFAADAAEKDTTIERIVFLAHTFNNTDMLDRAFGPGIADKFRKTYRDREIRVPIVLSSMASYAKGFHRKADLVIGMGLNDEQLFAVDDMWGVHSIIAIPWRREGMNGWVDQWGPIELRTKERPSSSELPSAVEQVAVRRLTEMVNMSGPLNHPNDEEDAKGVIRELVKNIPDLDSVRLKAYMVRELHWPNDEAERFKGWVDSLKEGRRFQGGTRTIHLGAFQHWVKLAEEGKLA